MRTQEGDYLFSAIWPGKANCHAVNAGVAAAEDISEAISTALQETKRSLLGSAGLLTASFWDAR
jgi:hypothetical protein